MPQSLANLLVHLVFSTKHRRPLLIPEVRSELEGYLVGALRQLSSPSLSTRAVQDHVHLLFTLARTQSVSFIVQEIKRSSSHWIKTRGRAFRQFQWQVGYGAFSVGPSQLASLRQYIAHQEEHHRTVTFQEEYRRLLREYAVEFDERYVWD